MNDRAIRSIMVAGDGLVGLSAALAFSRALPQATVTILALPPGPTELADLLPSTLPTIGRFHAAIGFDELELVAANIAHHHLGTRFTGFGPEPWTHSFGEVGQGEGAVPFHQLWYRAQQEGRNLPYDRYSAASVIGGMGKFVHPSSDVSSPLSTYIYGLRLDPARYRAKLDQAASHLRRIESESVNLERYADGAIAALLLDNGRREQADLFLDCTGTRALLCGESDPPFEDWSDWITPTDFDLEWAEAADPDPLDHFARDGSEIRWSATTSGGSLAANFRPGAAVRPGRRTPFVGNVLALGDAALALGPIHGTGLSLAHNAILRAIELLPGRNCHPLELAEYNRLTAQETERARDFVALHYLTTWSAPPPPSLARTLQQWRARGRLPFFEEETFDQSSWVEALIGMGILPDAVAPQALEVDSNAAASAMAKLASTIGALTAQLPLYPDYLARMAGRA